MHHDRTMIDHGIEKSSAYPQQIIGGLGIQRYAGPHAGMGEEVVAAPGARAQRCKKGSMRGW